jgi:hypothetical protein
MVLAMVSFTSKPPKAVVENLPSKGYRQTGNTAFRAGEAVEYLVHYGLMDAGLATLRVEESPYKFGDREAFHIVGTGKSIGSFDWFFKVRDHFETYVDKDGLFPHRFIRNCDEGGYKISEFVQDMLSAYYYARTLDYSNARPGDLITIETLVDDEIYPLQMKFIGKEEIKIGVGKFRCLKFAPVVQKGRIFKKEEDLSVWITDDANHLPVLAKAKILVGSIKMEMKSYYGLANPIAQVQ